MKRPLVSSCEENQKRPPSSELSSLSNTASPPGMSQPAMQNGHNFSLGSSEPIKPRQTGGGMINSLYQAQADEYRNKYVNLECEYHALKNTHAYEISKLKMQKEEIELRFNEKLSLEVAEQHRKHREVLL